MELLLNVQGFPHNWEPSLIELLMMKSMAAKSVSFVEHPTVQIASVRYRNLQGMHTSQKAIHNLTVGPAQLKAAEAGHNPPAPNTVEGFRVELVRQGITMAFQQHEQAAAAAAAAAERAEEMERRAARKVADAAKKAAAAAAEAAEAEARRERRAR
jgi:hypothetical protein